MNVGLTLAMLTDAREFIAVGESGLPMRASLSGTVSGCFSLGLGWDNIQRRRSTAYIAQNGRHMRYTRHNSADSVPTSNLVCITEVAIRTTFCIAGITYYTCNFVIDIQ